MPAPSVIVDGCVFLATSGGTGPFVEITAIPGYQTMEAAGALDGQQFSYRAQLADNSQWEIGTGIWTASTKTLTRVPLFSSLGTPTAVNFANPPQVLITALASDIGYLPLATSNLTFYVATTGSDSNPGTVGSPFATIQHALNVVTGFDYQAQFGATINVANGTYNESPNIQALKNPSGGEGIVITGNHASPTSVVLNGGFTQEKTCGGNNVTIDGFLINPGNFNDAFFWQAGRLLYGNINFAGTSINCFNISGVGVTVDLNPPQTLDLTAVTSLGAFCISDDNVSCNVHFGGATINFPPSLPVGIAFFNMNNSLIGYNGVTHTNFAGVSGTSVNVGPNVQLVTTNGLPSDIPGSGGPGRVHNTVEWFSGGVFGLGTRSLSGLPTTSNLLAGTWGVFKDTSGGGVYVAYNDAGTVKKVALT